MRGNLTDKKLIIIAAVVLAVVAVLVVFALKKSFRLKKWRMKNNENELKIRVERDVKTDSFTLGKMYINDVFLCYTLELPFRNGANIRKTTAILPGTYGIDMDTVSPTYASRGAKSQYLNCGNKVPRLVGVPGRDGVLIHIGNYTSNTDGCILVGTYRNTSTGTVSNSVTAFWQMYDILADAHNAGKLITITIN